MVAKEWLKSKGLKKEAFEPLVVPAIVILVGLCAFALGRLSASVGDSSGFFSQTVGQ